MVLKVIGILLALSLFGGVIWEHIAKKNESTFKPSTGFSKIVPISQDIWYWCGKQLARISSFLTFIKDLLYDIWIVIKNFFSGFLESVGDFFSPILEFLFSWTYLFKGYYETAKTYAYPVLIGAGTLLIAFIIVCIVTFLLTKYEYINASYSMVHKIIAWWYDTPTENVVPASAGAGNTGTGVAGTGIDSNTRITRQAGKGR